MYLNLRNAVWLTLLASAAIATGLLSRTPETDGTDSGQLRSTSLGYYLTGAVLVGTDQSGEVLYRIAAERIEENPETRELVLHSIELVYRDSHTVPWRVRAAAAHGPTTREYFDLTGGVSIERGPDSDGPAAKIEAASLRLEPESYQASTDGPVRFVLGETPISGVGLKAHLKDGQIDLKNVHAEIR